MGKRLFIKKNKAMLPMRLSRFGKNLYTNSTRCFSDFNNRMGKEFTGTHMVPNEQQYHVSPARPGNFGDHIDFKINLDNWFDENRTHNEEDVDVRRTHAYLLNGMFWGGVISLARLYAVALVGRLNGWKRYDRDSYMEFDVGELPPGEIIQVVWNGMPVFIRRLTQGEMDQEDQWPKSGILDTSTANDPLKCGNSYILVSSAICTHLGCVPIPYLGRFGGWACICHGSVFDKRARVRQGPAAENLKLVNATVYGDIICIEEKKFPREPSVRFWA